ncbi:hypothetical protein [Streptomyces sp. MT206]|uniref:hypothetical protein n=1 Tax=Streptomyces sp. MT206 TaxID=3031407 RepID=UPI002FC6236D
MARNPDAKRFSFADRSRHGSSGGNSMGRPAKSAAEADRQGWKRFDETNGLFGRSRRSRRDN